MNAADIRHRIKDYTYRMLRWGHDHVAPGVRSLVGLLLIVGGVFGFLPILGFWMLPLGFAFIALDVPPARRRIQRWMIKLKREVAAEREIAAEAAARRSKGDQPTSSQ